MSRYDIVELPMDCPFCKANQAFDVEVRFPNANLNTYSIGDTIIETYRDVKINDGYAQCIYCQRGFFVMIDVKDSVIISVEINAALPGYITE